MPPIRLKVWGILSMTRRGYLTALVLGLVVLVGLFIWSLQIQRPKALPADAKRDGQIEMLFAIMTWILDYLPWICLAVFALQILECWLVLRRFAQKEVQERQRETASTSLE